MDLRHKLDVELSKIDQEVTRMSGAVCNALEISFNLLHSYTAEVEEEVRKKDREIDNLEMAIDDMCVQFIATEQPVASDLRKVITITKITADLERIGDIARYIARNSKKEIPENFTEYVAPIIAMGKYGVQMLKDAMRAYVGLDEDACRSIAKRDDEMDENHHELRRKIIHSMKDDPDHVKNGQRLLVQSRLMELLGDHVTTICEWIIFANSGAHTDLN